MSGPPVPEPQKLTLTHWAILVMAAIGFAFDTYVLLTLPLVLRPALQEFGLKPDSPEFKTWLGIMFYVPAFAGGICGLLGGYLTDYFGRRRLLIWSFLLYVLSAFPAGFATTPGMLLAGRTLNFVGVCIEFVAAVAWLAELFPNPAQRERVLGYTQTFASLGGILIASANHLCVDLGRLLPRVQIPGFLAAMLAPIVDEHAAWRYTTMSGLVFAVPLIIILFFLPESPVWSRKKKEGTLRRPSFGEIFAPQFRRTTIVTTILFACCYGAAFGAIQMMPQIVPGLTHADKTGAVDKMEQEIRERQEKQAADDPQFQIEPAPKIKKLAVQRVASDYTKVQEIGGLIGRILLAILALYIVSRRWLLRIFQIPGLLIMPLVFYFFLTMPNTKYFEIPLSWLGIGALPITNVSLGMMFAGLVTVAQFSFWGNYLPRVYPVYLRGTGQSFGANIGGRLLGTSFAWVTGTLAGMEFIPGKDAPHKFAMAAAIVTVFVYLVGVIASCFLPEPKGELD